MANLYTGSGAESNRSDNLLLLAKMTVGEGTTDVTVKIDYTINKTTSTGFTKAGTRYGILVKNATVNSSGQLTSAGTKIASAKINTPPDGDSSGSVSFTFKKGGSATTYSGVTFLISDQDAVTRSSDTTYLWTGQKGSSVSALPSRFAVSSFTVPVGYTKCSPPKSGFTDDTSRKRGESFKMSWDAGTAGNNMTIKGYRIYMQHNKMPTLSSYKKTYDVSTNFKEWPELGLDVGNSYYYAVQTLGSKEGYDSDLSTNYTKVTMVNTAPTLDKVELNYSVLPYTGGKVTATFTATDPNDQTIKYQYSIHDGGGWTAWSTLSSTNPQTITLGGISQSTTSNKTYTFKFRANDGVDNSNIIGDKTVTVYAAPNVIVSSVGVNNEYSTANGKYYKTYKISASYQRSNKGTYTYYLLAGETQKELETSESNSYECDITEYSDWAGKDVKFGVSFAETLKSGTNTSAIKWQSQAIAMPAYFSSSKTKTYNNGSKNVVGESYFYNKMRFYVYTSDGAKYYDSGATAECSYSTDNKTWYNFGSSYVTNKATSSSNNYVVLNTSQLTEGGKYYLRLRLRRGSGTYNTYTTPLLTKIKKTIDFSSFKFENNNSTTGQTIYPHGFKWDGKEFINSGADVTNPGNQNIIFSKAVFEGGFNLYGLSDLSNVTLWTKRISGSYGNLNDRYELGTFELVGDYYKFELSDSYYNKEAKSDSTFYGLNAYMSAHQIKFWIEAYSPFGYTVESGEIGLLLDFRTPMIISEVKYYLGGTETEIGDYLYEGETIKAAITYKSFTNKDYSYTPTLSLTNSNQKYSSAAGSFKPTLENPKPEEYSLGVPLEGSCDIVFTSLPQFNSSTETSLRLKIASSDTITTTDAFHETAGYTTIKHINSSFTVEKGDYTETDDTTSKIVLTNIKTGDLGVEIKSINGSELDNKFYLDTNLQYSTNINFPDNNTFEITLEDLSLYSSFWDKDINSLAVQPSSENWGAEYYYVRLKTISTNKITGNYKTSYSNTVVVYNISPTISYRKNQLGINYELPKEETETEYNNAVLVIGQNNTKKQIIFVGSDNGELIGFTASGGTW